MPQDYVTYGVSAMIAVATSLFAFTWWRNKVRYPPLTTKFQSFPVLSTDLVTPQGGSPVIYLTLGVSTQEIPTGTHVKVRLPSDKQVTRPYTPARFNAGKCELLVRVYPGGVMSQYLASLKEGDAISMMGPTGLHKYGLDGPGSFQHGRRHKWQTKNVVMLAGGTGVTPMLQIINAAVNDPNDNTKLTLVLFNSKCADVMMLETLQELAPRSNGQLTVVFAVSETVPEKHASCFVKQSLRDLEDLIDFIPSSPIEEDKDDTMVCVCGPPGFQLRGKELALRAGFPHVLTW